LPAEFRAYLRHSAVVEDDDRVWDCCGTYWWPLSRLRNSVEELPKHPPEPVIAPVAETTLFFCDWIAWCGAWAISCGEGPERGNTWFYWNDAPRVVATDFGGFVDRYVENFNLVICRLRFLSAFWLVAL
jgi:hypothetical protein